MTKFINVILLIFIFNGFKCEENEECNLILSVGRSILKFGLHRDLQYSYELITNGMWDDCTICIENTFSKGLYVNKNQLEDFQRLGKISAIFYGKDDVESPESKAEPQTVLLYTNLTRTHNILVGLGTLPFHVRYHNPQIDGGYRKIKIPIPNIYIGCNLTPSKCLSEIDNKLLPCSGTTGELCIFKKIEYNINEEDLQIDVPVGNYNELEMVQIITLFVTAIGTAYICIVIISTLPKSYNK